jgi:hypothetical protein
MDKSMGKLMSSLAGIKEPAGTSYYARLIIETSWWSTTSFFIHIYISPFQCFFESTSSFLVPSTSNFLVRAYWGGDQAPHQCLFVKLSILYIHYTEIYSTCHGIMVQNLLNHCFVELIFVCWLIKVLIVNSMVQWNLYSCSRDSLGRLPFTCSSLVKEF